MAKLSDIFLSILGNTLQGVGGMTPAVKANLALRQSENARSNLSTLADINQNYNQLPPGFTGPPSQGSFTPDANTASLTGLTPGTTLQPISRTRVEGLYNPKKNRLETQAIDLPRGSTFGTSNAPVQILGQQMGFKKDLFDKYDSDMHTAQTALAGVASRLPKGIGQSLVDSVTTGVGIPAEFTQSPEYQANAGLINKFTQQYNEAKSNRDGVLNGAQGSNTQNPNAGSDQRPPPPTSLFSNVPLGSVAVYNKKTKQYGHIPQANMNPFIYDQVASPQVGTPQ